MNNYQCPYGKIKKNGITESIYCEKEKRNCRYTRYCYTKNGIEFSELAKKCETMKKENNKNL